MIQRRTPPLCAAASTFGSRATAGAAAAAPLALPVAADRDSPAAHSKTQNAALLVLWTWIAQNDRSCTLSSGQCMQHPPSFDFAVFPGPFFAPPPGAAAACAASAGDCERRGSKAAGAAERPLDVSIAPPVYMAMMAAPENSACSRGHARPFRYTNHVFKEDAHGRKWLAPLWPMGGVDARLRIDFCGCAVPERLPPSRTDFRMCSCSSACWPRCRTRCRSSSRFLCIHGATQPSQWHR